MVRSKIRQKGLTEVYSHQEPVNAHKFSFVVKTCDGFIDVDMTLYRIYHHMIYNYTSGANFWTDACIEHAFFLLDLPYLSKAERGLCHFILAHGCDKPV